MSFKCDDVSSFDVSKETWTIVVKVIRMWLSPCFGGSKLPNSMKLVLMDDKGCKIHALVRRTLVYKFKHQFSKGCVYQISFFGVCENVGDFRTNLHPVKLKFEMHTSVRHFSNVSIAKSPYSFVSIPDIMFKEHDSSFLIGVHYP